jgi:phage internal scaffolding protein|nr:MAG TPA: Scaffold protein [Microviridae sp.]
MKFNSRYSVTGEKPGITFDQPSQTLQSFRDDADINCIIARYENTGVLVDPTVPVSRTPDFGDFSDMPDYQTAQNVIIAAKNAFDSLSSKVRERFNNDPAAYFDFVRNLKEGSDEFAEAVSLGIVNKPVDHSHEVPPGASQSSGEKVNS